MYAEANELLGDIPKVSFCRLYTCNYDWCVKFQLLVDNSILEEKTHIYVYIKLKEFNFPEDKEFQRKTVDSLHDMWRVWEWHNYMKVMLQWKFE